MLKLKTMQLFCMECRQQINKSNNIFCSSSCAAKYNNRQRYKNGYRMSDESREKYQS